MYTIYIHKNLINKKVYIGQTKRKVEIRWGKNGKGYQGCPHFYSAILKYGWINFEHDILKVVETKDEANYWEEYYINLYQSRNPEKGYNILKGGSGEKPSKSIKMQNFYQILTKEEKKELYDNRRGIKNSNSRKVICIETGEEFDSLSAAAVWAGLLPTSGGNISSQIKGLKKSCGKHPITKQPLHWKFKNENLNPESLIIQMPNKKGTKVKNIETGLIFSSMVEAGAWAGVKNNRICESCKSNGIKAAGKHPEKKYKLHWLYYTNN